MKALGMIRRTFGSLSKEGFQILYSTYVRHRTTRKIIVAWKRYSEELQNWSGIWRTFLI